MLSLMAVLSLALTGCSNPSNSDNPTNPDDSNSTNNPTSPAADVLKKVDALDLSNFIPPLVNGAYADSGTTINAPEYSGSISYQTINGYSFSTFSDNTDYQAVVSLTAAKNYTFIGVAANTFTYLYATSVQNQAGNGSTITVTIKLKWPTMDVTYNGNTETMKVSGLQTYLISNITGDYLTGPKTVHISGLHNIDSNMISSITAQINNAQKYVNIVLTGCTFINNEIGSIGMSEIRYLEGLTLPDGLLTLSSTFCEQGHLTSISLPNSLTTIGDNSFFECNGLTSLIIPSKVVTIGKSVFQNCSSLTSISVDGPATIAGSGSDNPFNGDTALTIVNLNAGVTFDDGFAFPSNTSTTFTVTGKGKTKALDSGKCLTYNGCIIGWARPLSGAVVVPAGVTDVGKIFKNTWITGMTLPAGLTTIGNSAFYDCTSLTAINIPVGTTTIGDSAFYYCNGLTSITIPAETTSIGDSAFEYCSGLTSITILGRIATIGKSAFEHSGLTSITIPTGTTTIGNSAFEYCNNLASIVLSATVKNISNDAFLFCSNLTSITVDAGSANYSSVDGILFNKAGTEIIKYPEGKSLTSYTVPESVGKIDTNAFNNRGNLTRITLPNGVTIYDGNCFKTIYYCNGKLGGTYTYNGGAWHVSY
jgi:hypothetical protein